ncbi:MAG: metallophosphoesterase [Candidatus Gastranaerophilaceae bacterium]|nr:metallophosphoesterase [Candidatus Gastranaerophilaceae bacterium]
MLNKLFIFVLFIFFSVTSVFAGEIKFVQLTDVHFTVKSKYTADVLKATVKDINEQPNISFVVFTGDNIDSSHEQNLEEFLKIVKKLNVPYYIILGNHDVFKTNGVSKQRYYEIVRKYNFFSRQNKRNFVLKKGEFVFIGLDGAKETIPGPGGFYRVATLDWLDKQLTKNKRRKVVIMQHFPILPPSDLKSHRVYQPENYYAVLNKHNNVIAIISGHYHMNKEKMENGIYHISSPSLAAVTNPYKIIDIVTTKGFSPMIYTQIREVDFH